MKNICIFGDSVVCGEGDDMGGGWVNRLANHFKDFEIFNMGIDGGTILNTQEIFEKKFLEKDPDIIIFEAGGNDSAYDKDSKQFLVNENKFQEIVKELIESSEKITKNIIFVGFTNCDEKKTIPVTWRNLCYENNNIIRYNDIMKNVCRENNILFVDTFGILEENDFADGLHPNAIGHEKIFKKVKEQLISKH